MTFFLSWGEIQILAELYLMFSVPVNQNRRPTTFLHELSTINFDRDTLTQIRAKKRFSNKEEQRRAHTPCMRWRRPNPQAERMRGHIRTLEGALALTS